MEISQATLSRIFEEWDSAPRGGKRLIVKKWSKTLDCAPKTVYGLIESGRKRKKEGFKIEGLEQHAKIVAAIKKKPPKERGEISTDQAIRLAIENRVIPESMAEVGVSTFNRALRDLEMNKRERRAQRFQASRPNELHHIDASSSECFYVAKAMPDGDFILKLHSSSKGYKNKPVPVDRLRPWVYGLVDDYSGYEMARYTVTHGESLSDNLDFLGWAWGKNEEKPFFGLPEYIKADQGPLMKGKAGQEWLERLGVKILPSVPGEKRSHGKKERNWRTQWQRFEKVFFAEHEWKTFEITLSELNRRFFLYLEEHNNRRHRYEDMSRLQAWKTINLHGGAVALPEKAIATAVRRYSRVVGVDGCFSLDGVTYEVKGLHDAKVWVYCGIFDDRMIVEDQRTGNKYEVETFKPATLGEFPKQEETPHEKAVALGETLEIHNTLYATPAEQGNVRQFPTRIVETREVKDPLSIDSYGSVEDAMADFIGCFGYRIMGEEYETVKGLIVENGMDRNFVRELAKELQTECERRAEHG